MKNIKILLLGILLWLQYSLFIGNNGIYDFLVIKKNILDIQKYNSIIKKKNKIILLEIKNLHTQTDSIEERARNQLGMIKKNETFFRYVKNHNKSNISNK